MLTLVLALTLTASTPAAPAQNQAPWQIDRAYSKITFTVTKWGLVEVTGRFHDFTGSIHYDAAAPERSRIDLRVKVATVDTGEPARDQALQAREYFDAARNPELSFVSSKVTSLSPTLLEVLGTISMRGVSKPLIVQVAYGGRHNLPDLGPMDLFQTTFTINRLDFGIVGGSLLGPVISNHAKITLIAAARPGS